MKTSSNTNLKLPTIKPGRKPSQQQPSDASPDIFPIESLTDEAGKFISRTCPATIY